MTLLSEHFDGYSYYDNIEFGIGELILDGLARNKQLMALGMSFANLIDMMERNHEPLEFMKVHIRVQDSGDKRSLFLLITPAYLHEPKVVSFGN